MARKKQSRAERFKQPPPGVCLKGCMIDDEYRASEAYATLSGTAHSLLMGFLARRRYNPKNKRNKKAPKYTNLTDIVYTLDCMMYETNTTNKTVLEARQTLMDLGFIDLLDQADWGKHQNNRWRISKRFLKWHPDEATRINRGFEEHRPTRKKTMPKKHTARPQLAIAN